MPVMRTISACAVMITGAIRQASPEGSPLTGAIILASGVNLISSVKEIVDVYNTPEKAPEVITHDIETQTESTHFRDCILARRSRSETIER